MSETKKKTSKSEEKRVKIKIPLDPLNPERKIKKVIYNGYFYQIELGKEVEVPLHIKKLLEDKGVI